MNECITDGVRTVRNQNRNQKMARKICLKGEDTYGRVIVSVRVLLVDYNFVQVFPAQHPLTRNQAF